MKKSLLILVILLATFLLASCNEYNTANTAIIPNNLQYTEYEGIYFEIESIDYTYQAPTINVIWHNEADKTATLSYYTKIFYKDGGEWENTQMSSSDICEVPTHTLLPRSTIEISYTTYPYDLSKTGTYMMKTSFSIDESYYETHIGFDVKDARAYSYSLSINDTERYLIESPQKTYKAYERVTLRAHIIIDADLSISLNNKDLPKKVVLSDGNYIWEYYFTMPSYDSQITMEVNGDYPIPDIKINKIKDAPEYAEMQETSEEIVVHFFNYTLNGFDFSITDSEEIDKIMSLLLSSQLKLCYNEEEITCAKTSKPILTIKQGEREFLIYSLFNVEGYYYYSISTDLAQQLDALATERGAWERFEAINDIVAPDGHNMYYVPDEADTIEIMLSIGEDKTQVNIHSATSIQRILKALKEAKIIYHGKNQPLIDTFSVKIGANGLSYSLISHIYSSFEINGHYFTVDCYEKIKEVVDNLPLEQEFITQYNASYPSTQKREINHFYGKYKSGALVATLTGVYEMAEGAETVADVCILYPNSCRILVLYNGECYNLNDAYENGALSYEDLVNINKKQKELYPYMYDQRENNLVNNLLKRNDEHYSTLDCGSFFGKLPTPEKENDEIIIVDDREIRMRTYSAYKLIKTYEELSLLVQSTQEVEESIFEEYYILFIAREYGSYWGEDLGFRSCMVINDELFIVFDRYVYENGLSSPLTNIQQDYILIPKSLLPTQLKTEGTITVLENQIIK